MPYARELEPLWTRYLGCPTCGGALQLSRSGLNLNLECTLCKIRYPVREGIPCFVSVTGSDQSSEIVQRDLEAASYEGNFLAWETYLEVAPLAHDLAPRKTDVVLDVGAGTGRLVREYIRDVKVVVAVDLSFEALRMLRRSLELVGRAAGKLVVAQADACALPIRAETFDAVVSVGMLQHLPSADHRSRALRGMARALRPGGRFVLQARHWSPVHALHDERRDDERIRRVADILIGNADGGLRRRRMEHHAGGTLSIYNFTADELREMIEAAGLHVDRLVGRLITVKGMHRLGILRPVVERFIERTPLSRVASQELVAMGTRGS